MFRKSHYGYLFLTCAIMLCPYNVNGQSVEENKNLPGNYWGVEAGLGPSTLGGPEGSLAVKYQLKKAVYSLRMAVLGDFELFSDGSTSLTDVHVMAGVEGPFQPENRVFGTFPAGLSGIYKEECVANCGIFDGPATFDNKFGFGIPVEAGLSWKPVRFVGIGISGHASLNFLKPYASANIYLRFGKLR